MGYLPEALRNYLLRLGWSQGDKEFFTTEEAQAAFDLDSVGRSPSRFDYVKLENMNGHYMRASSDDALMAEFERALPYLEQGRALREAWTPQVAAQLRKAMTGLKERAKTLNELADGAAFLVARRPLKMDEKAAEILAKGGKAHLAELLPALTALPAWSAAACEAAVRAYVEASGAKLGQVAQPLRAALTGRSTSPGIFDVLEVLGRDESLGRLADAAL